MEYASMLQQEVLSIIKSKIDEDITPDTEFSATGIDSVMFIKIVVCLEEEFDIEFEDKMLINTAFTTINSMVEYVMSKAHFKLI